MIKGTCKARRPKEENDLIHVLFLILFTEEIEKLGYHTVHLGVTLYAEDVLTVFGSLNNVVTELGPSVDSNEILRRRCAKSME